MVMGPEKAMAFAKQQRLAVYLVIKTDKGFKNQRNIPESFEPFWYNRFPDFFRLVASVHIFTIWPKKFAVVRRLSP